MTDSFFLPEADAASPDMISSIIGSERSRTSTVPSSALSMVRWREAARKLSGRAFVAPIELTTGKQAYYMGKPNPLMMRTGLHILGLHSAEAAMIGDRMDTDMIAGIETGLDTVLVLSGVSVRETPEAFPYRPRLILNSVGDIPETERSFVIPPDLKG